MHAGVWPLDALFAALESEHRTEEALKDVKTSKAGKRTHDQEVTEVMSELSPDYYPGCRMLVLEEF